MRNVILDPALYEAAAPITALEMAAWLALLGRAAGRKRPMSGAALARMLGSSEATVHRWTRGETRPPAFLRLALHQVQWILRQHASRSRQEFLLALSRAPLPPRTPLTGT